MPKQSNLEKQIDDYVFCNKCENNPCICKQSKWEEKWEEKLEDNIRTYAYDKNLDEDFNGLVRFIKKEVKQNLIEQQSYLLRKHEETIDYVLAERDKQWLSCLPERENSYDQGHNICLETILENAKKLNLIK